MQPHSGLGDPGLGQSDVIQQTLQQYFNVDMQQSHEGDRKDGNGGGDRNHHVSVLPAILDREAIVHLNNMIWETMASCRC